MYIYSAVDDIPYKKNEYMVAIIEPILFQICCIIQIYMDFNDVITIYSSSI